MHFSLHLLFVRLSVCKVDTASGCFQMHWRIYIYSFILPCRLWKHFTIKHSRTNDYDSVCLGWYSNEWFPICLSR